MKNDESIDISDPQDAMRFASALAGEMLACARASVVAAPPIARIAFFEAYLAVLIGAMRATLGETMAAAALNHVADAINAEKDQAAEKPRVH